MMFVVADKALIMMIENKQMFLELIDYMDENRVDEIPIRLYEKKIRCLLGENSAIPNGKKVSDPGWRKIQATLNIENLQRARIVIDMDERRGKLAFAPFVVDMFRHFDNARLRQLSSADLEALRTGFIDSYRALRAMPSLLQSNDDFNEALRLLRHRIREAQAQIKESVDSLQGQADKLAEIVDSTSYDDLDTVRQAQQALEGINRIYLRHVLPILQFLDEHAALKGVAALTSLTMIANLFRDGGEHVVARDVLYAITTIRSYRADVELIRKSLARYVGQSKRQRHEYDCIERAFNKLLAASRELHDGRLKYNVLPTDHGVFRQNPVFIGLKGSKNAARLEWRSRNHWAYLQEHLRVHLGKTQAERIKTHEIQGDDPSIIAAKIERERRREMIGRIVSTWPLRVSSDVHAALHECFCKQLLGYELPDLLDGLAWLKHRSDAVMTPIYAMDRISKDGLQITYYKIALSLKTSAGEQTHERAVALC